LGTFTVKEYVEDLGSPSSNLMITLKFPVSELQLIGLNFICVLEIS